ETAARAAGRSIRARWRGRHAARRRSRHCSDESRSAPRCEGRTVSRGSVLSSYGFSAAHSPTARAARRYTPAGHAPGRAGGEKAWHTAAAHRRTTVRAPPELRLARQCARAAEPAGTRGDSLEGRQAVSRSRLASEPSKRKSSTVPVRNAVGGCSGQRMAASGAAEPRNGVGTRGWTDLWAQWCRGTSGSKADDTPIAPSSVTHSSSGHRRARIGSLFRRALEDHSTEPPF